LCVEEAQERCVLRQEGLDLGNAGARPVLHPGLAEVVLDLMEAALAHGRKYRHWDRTAPWAKRLIRGITKSHTLGPLRGFLIVNPRAGKGGRGRGEVGAGAAGLGIRVHVLGETEKPAEIACAADAEVVGVAGGDGSLAEVAGVALERDIPFVCVP